MSQWHRDNPEAWGTDADPWMMHASYRNAVRQTWRESRDYCSDCGAFLEAHERGRCEECG